jgi:transcriptional antiterminator RfaH
MPTTNEPAALAAGKRGKHMGKHWYVARTKTGKEAQAAVSVASCGFAVFLPVHPVARSHARKQEIVNKPLFPRYLFVAFDPELKTHGPINNCRGVANRGLIVTSSGEPIPVPDLVMDQIRDRELAMLAKVGEAATGYEPGDTFKLSVGTYADFELTYLGEDKGKVTAIVTLLGRGHVVNLNFDVVPRKLIDSVAA